MSLSEVLASAPQNATIQKAMLTAHAKLEEYDRVLCSVSGGSDSDIMMDILERVKPEGKEIIYVWFDTGLEYEATKRHLPELEKKYGVDIHREKAVVPVAAGCKRYGVPFLSKRTSNAIGRLQRHGFAFDTRANISIPSAKWASDWWNGKWKNAISKDKLLKEFTLENPPAFAISDRCCDGAKKRTAHQINVTYQADLVCVGLRRAEGGVRAYSVQTCFSAATNTAHAQYRPLFFFSDKDKAEYKNHYGIVFSDCYEVWGMKRTGCAGCPFNSHFEEDLEKIKQYEPKLYDAANAIFGESYAYTQAYRAFKEAHKDDPHH